MSESTPISVRDTLIEFGFVPDLSPTAEIDALKYDFSDFTLSVKFGFNKWIQPSVIFWGFRVTNRTYSELIFQLSPSLESKDQLSAYLAYYLRSVTESYKRSSLPIPDWLLVGEKHSRLLPWEIEMAAYEARPRCYVEREWLRLGLKTLAAALAEVSNDESVTFGFDGRILTIKWGEKAVPLIASGEAWSIRIVIATEKLRLLPKRLTGNQVEVSVFDDALRIANHRYSGIVENLVAES